MPCQLQRICDLYLFLKICLSDIFACYSYKADLIVAVLLSGQTWCKANIRDKQVDESVFQMSSQIRCIKAVVQKLLCDFLSRVHMH